MAKIPFANFGRWAMATVYRYAIAIGGLWATPLFLYFSYDLYVNGNPSFAAFARIFVISAIGGAVWSLAMWFTVIAPLKSRRQSKGP
jgi:hypothetical protein